MAQIIISIKIDEWGINGPISWRCRTQNISKNQNLPPHQSRITLFTLQWDTLYLNEGIPKCLEFTEVIFLLNIKEAKVIWYKVLIPKDQLGDDKTHGLWRPLDVISLSKIVGIYAFNATNLHQNAVKNYLKLSQI